MNKIISYDGFIKRIIFLTTITIALLFGIYGYFIQSGSIKENLKSETSLFVDLIFQNLYTAMKNGADKKQLDEIIKNLEKNIPNSSIHLYKSPKNSKEDFIKEVFENKESDFFTHDSHIDFARPIIFKDECIKCHTDNKKGDIAAVIQLEFSILDLYVSLKDILVMISILFIISIIVIFIVWYTYLKKYFINPIKQLIVKMSKISGHKDLERKITINTPIKEVKEIEKVFNRQKEKLTLAYNELERASNTDPLTKIFNRKRFDEVMEEELQKVKRYGYPLSLILIDLNKFKFINDTYGHNAGDLVLIRFTETISKNIRTADRFFRIGGDEFILVLSHTKNEDAVKLTKHLKEHLKRSKLKYKENYIPINASFGIAQYGTDGTDKSGLIKTADERMYRDKKA